MATMAMMKKPISGGLRIAASRAYASLAVGSDIVSAAPNVSLPKACSYDEGVSSKFATTPLQDIFKGKKVVIFGVPGAFTGVCSAQHVPSYKTNVDKFKAKGIESIVCVSVNDPYVMNGWAEKLEAKDAVCGMLARTATWFVRTGTRYRCISTQALESTNRFIAWKLELFFRRSVYVRI
ncbi:peroxiredoxin-2F, mitochondrial-like isoform X2 [Chenopodium quinoa]|uniref:peroxiredoxin-2F, mitochondrial-like isoform X2 n=1 Tax=Chenopodium quinoa TaxID=63459 RepID=UPI000B76E620|nr:peroxiredoxin-2F, mitochondrial-like isoform X2 [Chenopodium quinoa]